MFAICRSTLVRNHMRLAKPAFVLLTALALLSLIGNVSSAQASREPELKGKMVGILGSLITWPNNTAPSRANPLTIGIIGNDPFVDERGVNHLEQKLAGTGAVLLHFADTAAYRKCHILVVPKSVDVVPALAKTAGSPVLVVTESPGLAKQGAAINLVYDIASNKIRLEINPGTAKKADLQINQGLLRSPLVDIVN